MIDFLVLHWVNSYDAVQSSGKYSHGTTFDDGTVE